MGHAALTAPGTTRLALVSGWLLVVVWAAELAALLTRAPTLSRVAMAGLAAFVALALLRASRHIRVLFVLVGGTAVLIAVLLGDWRVLLRGFERVQIFGAFFPAVLLLRATAETSPIADRLSGGVGQLDADQARAWTLYGSHGLGVILNVGAMAVLAPVVARGAGEARRLALATGAAHGVGTAVMWSPFFVSLAFVSQLAPAARLWQSMLVGAGAALMGLVLSHALYTPKLRGRRLVQSVRLLGGLTVPTAVMVGAVVGSTIVFGFSGLQAVAIVLPVLCAGYLALRGTGVAVDTARRALASFGRLSDELLIVVGSMVLGVAVGSIPTVAQLAAGMTPGVIAGAPLLVALVVVLVGLGQLGLHPMVGASVIVPVIAAGSFGISPPVLVATVVFAWGLSASISIWTLPVSVAATTFNVPVARLWTGKAVKFAFALAVGALAYFALINAWLAAGAPRPGA